MGLSCGVRMVFVMVAWPASTFFAALVTDVRDRASAVKINTAARFAETSARI